MGFADGSGSKESTCTAGDLGSIPGEDSLEEGWLATPVFLPGESRGAWQATAHEVAKSRIGLND